MNILLLNYEYPPLGGGGGVVSEIIAGEFAGHGHKVVVLTSHIRGEKLKEQKGNLTVYRLPVLGRNNTKKASVISMLTWPIVSIPFGIYLGFRYKFDLINTHFLAPTGPTGWLLSKLFKIPNLIYVHGADVYDPERLNFTPSGNSILAKLLRFSAKIQLWTAQGIMCQSNDIKNRINKLFPDLKKEIKNFPFMFIRPDYNLKKTRDDKYFQLVSVGRLVKRKGFDVLIQAMGSLPGPIILKIIGDGPESTNLKRLITKLKLENRVELLGFVNESEKYKILFNSDCFVLSSHHEGMGVVVQEAMYCGLPIVSTNKGGQTDLLAQEVNALLVEPNNPEILARTIKRVYEDKELENKMMENNRRKIEEYYPERLFEKYERYFKEIARNKI